MKLKNYFLISMPHMVDSFFNKSIIYLCEHETNGAMGVIINKNLCTIKLEFENKYTLCKYLVPIGYPKKSIKNKEIILKNNLYEKYIRYGIFPGGAGMSGFCTFSRSPTGWCIPNCRLFTPSQSRSPALSSLSEEYPHHDCPW